ncbi:hypothetical protein ACLOJK_016385 [Asimina triloba]
MAYVINVLDLTRLHPLDTCGWRVGGVGVHMERRARNIFEAWWALKIRKERMDRTEVTAAPLSLTQPDYLNLCLPALIAFV